MCKIIDSFLLSHDQYVPDHFIYFIDCYIIICRFLVRVSYFEIYNEEIRDLLTKNSTKLEVKERPDVGVFVKDLSTYIVNNADDMDRIMTLGNKNSKSLCF